MNENEPKRISRDEALRRIAGDTPEDAVSEGRCLHGPIGCNRPISEDELAGWSEVEAREYVITGLCPRCQV